MINSITINDRGLSSKRKNAVCVREMRAERLAITSNSGSRTLTPSSGFCRHCTHMVHIHTYRQGTYTDKNKINTWKIVELDRITNVLVHINIYRILLQTIV